MKAIFPVWGLYRLWYIGSCFSYGSIPRQSPHLKSTKKKFKLYNGPFYSCNTYVWCHVNVSAFKTTFKLDWLDRNIIPFRLAVILYLKSSDKVSVIPGQVDLAANFNPEHILGCNMQTSQKHIVYKLWKDHEVIKSHHRRWFI